MSRREIEELYQILRGWEKNFSQTPNLEEIKKRFSLLSDPHLAQLHTRIHMKISPQELFNLLVPLERNLQKSLRDDEFMVLEKDKALRPHQQVPLFLVLENIRSAFNVGSLFRTAEALGLEGLYLAGYTATPESEKVQKTSLSTEAWIPWKQVTDSQEAVKELKQKNVRVVAVETTREALDLSEPFWAGPTAFVFGNERFGLDLESLRAADEVRSIPLLGRKNSLNVANCAAICCYEWIRQWNLNLK